MTESSWWSSHVKPRWHDPKDNRVAWKVQDAHNSGLPDVDCCFWGQVAKIELKYLPKRPVRDTTVMTFSFLNKERTAKSIVSAAQTRHLDEWHNAGGLSLVLIGLGKEWFLFQHGGYDNQGMSYDQMGNQCIARGHDYHSLATIPTFIKEYNG